MVGIGSGPHIGKMPDPFRHSLDSAERDARVRSVLARLQLADTAQQRVRELSGGQQRRLAIAVELLTDPPLLMLDEPPPSAPRRPW